MGAEEGSRTYGSPYTLTWLLTSQPHFSIADAILNGLEIFKLNESYGSVAGPNPDAVPAPALAYMQHPQNSKSKGRLSELIITGATLLFVIFALLFLVVYFFILRNRRRIWCWVSGQAEQIELKSGCRFFAARGTMPSVCSN